MSAAGFYENHETSKPVIDRHQALMWEIGDLMHQWESLATEQICNHLPNLSAARPVRQHVIACNDSYLPCFSTSPPGTAFAPVAAHGFDCEREELGGRSRPDLHYRHAEPLPGFEVSMPRKARQAPRRPGRQRVAARPRRARARAAAAATPAVPDSFYRDLVWNLRNGVVADHARRPASRS